MIIALVLGLGLGMAAATYRLLSGDPVRAKNAGEISRTVFAPSMPRVVSTNAMIAATTGGVAVESGIEVLKEGGTAADAAMTVARGAGSGLVREFCWDHEHAVLRCDVRQSLLP